MSDNPYDAPKGHFSDLPPQPLPAPGGLSPGMVNMVRVVSIMMIVQGALEVLMGVMLIGMGAFMNVAFQMDQGNNPPPQEVGWIMLAVYGGMGVLHLFPAGLHIFAGIRNYKFRGRTLGYVALSSGLLTVMGCYCLFTALALAIFGIIVYSDSSVARAFQMGEEGHDGDQILATFNNRPFA